ncbi:MAG: DUF3667 domain-containing protein [Gemmatimonadetes bacterium]|nr:DUF3667 domain-containing protein [Gemmatimonadota bacterium]
MMHDAPTETKACLNCGKGLAGSYCSSCGQAAQSPLKPLLEFVQESLSEVLSLDGTQIRSLRALLTKPGLLSAEYLDGRRTHYVHPVRLFIVVGVVSYFVTTLFPEQRLLFSMGPVLFGSEAVGVEFLFLAAIIPVGALAHWIVLRRTIPFFLGHLVFVLHVVAFSFVLSPIEAVLSWATATRPVLSLVGLVAPLAWAGYWLAALSRVLGGTFREALKPALFIYILFVTFLGPFAWLVDSGWF